MSNFCTQCGNSLNKADKYCANCGNKLEPVMIPTAPIQTSNAGDSQASYMPNDLFDNMVVLSLKAILIREDPRDLGYVRENFRTHESFVSGLIGLYDLNNFRSEVQANLKYQVMTASRTLADIYQGVDKTSDVDHETYMPSVIWSCEYYFDKYSKEFDRSGKKKGFLKRTFRGTAFNKNPNLDPNRVRNSIEAIKQALAMIRIGNIRI